MNRTERQKLCIRRWLNNKGNGIIQACTGFGKTWCAIMLIKAFYNKNNDFKVLILVPTEVLKKQWIRILTKNNLNIISKVEIMDTAINNKYNVNLLIIDEIHSICTKRKMIIFKNVNYKYILGLTATLHRLDGNEKFLDSYLSICDTITLEEALKNNWISNYRNYKVLLDVDLTEYKNYDVKFRSLFNYFNNDFNLIRLLLKDKNKLDKWCIKFNKNKGATLGYLSNFMKYLRLRKQFVKSHYHKFEIVNKILYYRKDKKTILFTATINDAKKFQDKGYVYYSKDKSKNKDTIIELFNNQSNGLIISPGALKTGVDVQGLSLGISCSFDSSSLLNIQALGRVIRYEENKIAEFFTLVIKDTIEENWYNNANKDQNYITINEKELDLVLSNNYISKRPNYGVEDLINRY